MAATLERLQPPTVRELELVRPPAVLDPRWTSATERLSFGPLPIAPADLSAAAIDRFIADVLSHYGLDGARLDKATLTVSRASGRSSLGGPVAPLTATIRRERNGPGFVARSSIGRAFGYGETVGEAFLDCLHDLDDRMSEFARERERLGPGPRAELARFERCITANVQMPAKRVDVQRLLERVLQFERDERDHHVFRLFYRGRLIARTKTSHSHDTIGDELLAMMARQMHITAPLLRDLLAGKKQQADYLASLRQHGLLPPDD